MNVLKDSIHYICSLVSSSLSNMAVMVGSSLLMQYFISYFLANVLYLVETICSMKLQWFFFFYLI